MAAIPLSNFTVRATTGTNEIASLAGIFVESPGGGPGPPPPGSGKRAVVFVIMCVPLLLLLAWTAWRV